MLLGYLKVVNEFSNLLKASKNGILSSEGMFSEEYFKGGLVLMFMSLKISERASKLVKIVEEEVNVVNLVLLHDNHYKAYYFLLRIYN